VLAESHLECRTGKIQAQAHQRHDEGNQEEAESDNQRMFQARRTRLTEKCVQGPLLVSVLSNGSEGWSLQISS
jgi:hypothetical protein